MTQASLVYRIWRGGLHDPRSRDLRGLVKRLGTLDDAESDLRNRAAGNDQPVAVLLDEIAELRSAYGTGRLALTPSQRRTLEDVLHLKTLGPDRAHDVLVMWRIRHPNWWSREMWGEVQRSKISGSLYECAGLGLLGRQSEGHWDVTSLGLVALAVGTPVSQQDS
jgi:hypothetical protein